MGHTRIYLTALTALLVPAGTGVMALHASPTCEKFVKTYVSTPVRNRVSKTTAVAWAKWREGHPNWKPNPRVTRPRYKMSQHEVMKKIDFACQVLTEPKVLNILFPPEDLNPPASRRDGTPLETTDVTVPDTIPPLVAELPPSSDNAFPPDTSAAPYFPPAFGGAPVPPLGSGTVHVSVPPGPPDSGSTTPVLPVSPVPEPSSLILMLVGVGAGTARMWRARTQS